MRVTLSKWGNSLALRVPKDIAELAGFQEGQALELTLDGKSIVLSKKRYDIDEMVSDMAGKEWPPLELDDAPVGSEIL
jgi:antitoxin MazE